MADPPLEANPTLVSVAGKPEPQRGCPPLGGKFAPRSALLLHTALGKLQRHQKKKKKKKGSRSYLLRDLKDFSAAKTNRI